MSQIIALIACLSVGGLITGCTTHTHERDAPPTVIHQDITPSSSAAKEGAREGAREGVRERGM